MNRVLGKASERYRTIPGQEVIASGLGVSFPGSGQIFERTSDPAGLPAVADGNRGAILTDIAIDYGGRTWALGLKGVGARVGMYQAEWGDPGALHLRAEAWFGDSPWGGQGDVNASRGLEITALAPLGHWNGFHICPVIEAVEFPAEHVAVAQSHFWYRR